MAIRRFVCCCPNGSSPGWLCAPMRIDHFPRSFLNRSRISMRRLPVSMMLSTPSLQEAPMYSEASITSGVITNSLDNFYFTLRLRLSQVTGRQRIGNRSFPPSTTRTFCIHCLVPLLLPIRKQQANGNRKIVLSDTSSRARPHAPPKPTFYSALHDAFFHRQAPSLIAGSPQPGQVGGRRLDNRRSSAHRTPLIA